MQAGLTWPQARALARSGSNVRRAQWADRWIFSPRGVLFWLETLAGTRRVVTAADFQRPEFLAADWTDAAIDQNKCVGLPPLEASLALSPTTVTEGGASTATLSIPGPLVVDAVFSITTHPRGRATHVGTVTIPAGSTSVTFTVTTIDVDLPSGIIVTAASELFGIAQAALTVLENVMSPPPAAPPPGVPWVRRFTRSWVAPGNLFSQGIDSQSIATFVRNYGSAVVNPFSTTALVSLTGSVTGQLLLYVPSPVIAGSGVAAAISGAPIAAGLPASFSIPAGGSFTIFARGGGSGVFEPTGYDVTATIST